MKSSEPVELLRTAIERSGLSARAFAKDILLRDERTVRRWLAGDSPIPQAVIDWLRGSLPDIKVRGVCDLLSKSLREETGMPSGVSIIRWGVHTPCVKTSVEEFLSRPENQSGAWFIDGGWGGPPGRIKVEWHNGQWVDRGFPPYDE